MMRIEKIEPSRHKKGRVLVFLEDGTLIKVTEEELLRFSLRKGDVLEEDTLKALRASAESSSAKADAASLIGRRPMSTADLLRKLRDKGVTQTEASYAAEWLTAIGALDDAAYAAMLVRHYSASGYGERYLRDCLRRHGIEREVAEEALAGAPPAVETARSFLATRFQGRKPDEKELKRASDALLRRGFSWSEAREALRAYREIAEEEFL